MKRGIWTVVGVVLAIMLLLQARTIRTLRNDLGAIKAEVAALSGNVQSPEPGQLQPQPRPVSLGNIPHRVTTLEEQIAGLSKTAQMLVDRGMVPPTQEQSQQIQSRFFDPNASDRDRLAAFRLIRRSGPVTDDIATQAMNWLQSSTNGNTKRELLSQLDGLTNSVMREPLLAFLATETNGRVREELVDVLADFSSDPAVEQKLWDLAINDPNPDIREEAQDAITDGPVTPQKVENFKIRASNSQLPLDERLMALRGLREANASAPEVMTEMANLAQTSTDPVTRAKIFGAFDGINDPTLMPALVSGLQDANPVVREHAADALGSYSSDPRIQQWLNHLIQNDTDPRVKREAHQALAESQRTNRRGGGRNN
jgi:hypothetical protein